MKNQLPEDLHIVAFTVDMTDEEIKGAIVQCLPRVQKASFGALLTISGYDDDPRELHEIPESIAFFKRLSDIGFISILEVSSSVDGIARIPKPSPGLGAFEVWAFGNQKVTANSEFGSSILKEFLPFLEVCNRKCEEIMKDAANYKNAAEGWIVKPGKAGQLWQFDGQHRHGNPEMN